MSPSPLLHLDGEVHLGYCGVSAGVSRGIWWVKEATQTTIPRMPWGPIKASDYSPFGGGGEGEGLPAAAAGAAGPGGSDSD